MKRAPSIVVGLGAAAVLAVGLLVSGVLPVPGQDAAPHPPCEELPSRGEVDDALAQNPGLVEDLESIGSSVSVETGLPCDDQPDRALVRIIYTSGDQRGQIDTLLQQDTFGVPAQVIQQ